MATSDYYDSTLVNVIFSIAFLFYWSVIAICHRRQIENETGNNQNKPSGNKP